MAFTTLSKSLRQNKEAELTVFTQRPYLAALVLQFLGKLAAPFMEPVPQGFLFHRPQHCLHAQASIWEVFT